MNKTTGFSFFIFCIVISIACKCGWGGNFLRVAPHGDIVVKVKVIGFEKMHSDVDEKMNVEVLTVFKGNEKRKKISVFGDNGMLCRPYINIFKKDAVYYLGLNKDGDEYAISVCGEYWLKVNSGKIKMAKNEDEKEAAKEMSVKEFEKLLKEKINK